MLLTPAVSLRQKGGTGESMHRQDLLLGPLGQSDTAKGKECPNRRQQQPGPDLRLGVEEYAPRGY